MANVEQLNILEGQSYAASNISNNTLQNKEAWLRSLEKAGLFDAMGEAKVVKAADSKLVAMPADNSGDTNYEMPRKDGLEQALGSSVGGTYQVGSLGLTQEENVQGSYAQSKESLEPVYATGVALSTIVESGQATDEIEPQIFAKSASLDFESLRYPWRNVFMLRSGSSIELWVRDASLSQSKLSSVLIGLRQSMGSLGASLVRVVLNGKEVFSASPSEQIKALSTKG